MKPINSYQNCASFDLMSMNLTWKAEVGTLILEQYSFQNISETNQFAKTSCFSERALKL